VSGKRPTITDDKADMAFLKFIASKDAALGEHLLRDYMKNALLDRVARVVRAKPIKITLAKYRAAEKLARSRKDLARRLDGASLEAVRKFERKWKISPTKKKRLAKNS
jgi:hypothetical protein